MVDRIGSDRSTAHCGCVSTHSDGWHSVQRRTAIGFGIGCSAQRHLSIRLWLRLRCAELKYSACRNSRTALAWNGMAWRGIASNRHPVQSSPVQSGLSANAGWRIVHSAKGACGHAARCKHRGNSSTALRCTALRCTALQLHCTALHCTALRCNCDRSYSVPAASLSLRSGVTAQAVTRRAMRGCHSTTVCQQCTGRVCIVSSCAPWHTALCSQECMLHLPRRVLHCVRCALEVARWCRVPQAVCRFALCTVDSRYFVWLPGRFARGNAARRSRWHCGVLAAVCGGT